MPASVASAPVTLKVRRDVEATQFSTLTGPWIDDKTSFDGSAGLLSEVDAGIGLAISTCALAEGGQVLFRLLVR